MLNSPEYFAPYICSINTHFFFYVWCCSRGACCSPSSLLVIGAPPQVPAWSRLCLMLMWALSRTLSVCPPVYLCLCCALAHPSPVSPPPPHPEMCDNGDSEDKPPAPPVRMSSTIFSTGSGKDSLSANHSSKPLPSVPEERKPRNKIISIFSGAEKSEETTAVKATTGLWWVYSVITPTSLFYPRW